MLNLYAQLNKFHSKFYAAEYVSTRSQNIPQMQLHYKTRPTKHRAPNSSSHRSQYNVFSMRREQIQLLHNRDFAHRLSFRRTAPRGSLAVCFKTPRTAHGKLNFATIFAHAAVSIPRPTTRSADSMKAELRRCSAHPFQSRQLAAPIEP